tara:strand:+ start:7097 stop:7936 length:840 start_codon:yes stop_codon:yes gene_type:complete
MSKESSYAPTDGLTLRVSKSSLITYMMCPRKFYWNYVADLPRPPASEAMIRGGLVHTVMEEGLLQGPNAITETASTLGIVDDPAIQSLSILIHQLAHDLGGMEVIESEVKHEIPEVYEGEDIMWVGIIDGLIKTGNGMNIIIELKTGKMNMGKLARTRKELVYYYRLLELMGNYETPTHFLYISPDYEIPEDGNDKLLLEGNKRGKRIWLGPEQGIAILEPIGKRSINSFAESLKDTISSLRLQQWPMNWSDYFCPLWCEFCLNCEAELTGNIKEGGWI